MEYLSSSQRVKFSLYFHFQSYFYSHGFKHFPSNCPSLFLLYLKIIKRRHTRYHTLTHDKKRSNLWGVIVTTCLMSSNDTFTYPPILHVSTGFIRNFCVAHNTLCLRSALFFVTIFPNFSRVLQSLHTNWSPSSCKILGALCAFFYNKQNS